MSEGAEGRGEVLHVVRPDHVPVLLNEVVQLLDPQPGETYVDCTAGLGGHAAAIAECLGPAGLVVLFDLDATNLARASARLRNLASGPRVESIQGSFAVAPRRLAELGIAAQMVLADLGFASNQMGDPARGFSFMHEGPLDMRLDPASPITAAELVNTLPEQDLVRILEEFGEEPSARLIARKLVQERAGSPIQTTLRFAETVRAAIPAKLRFSMGIDPATRSFQALRIAVNDELGNLAGLLAAIERAARLTREGRPAWLTPGARVAIIGFHSLEDRPVKQSFAAIVESGMAQHLTRKPVTASQQELDANPRARSARLRALRLGASTVDSPGPGRLS